MRVSVRAGGRRGHSRRRGGSWDRVAISPGKGSLPSWGGMEWSEGVPVVGRDVRRQRGVSGAHPHLVQLVLEHF